jgi:hypothetical protein
MKIKPEMQHPKKLYLGLDNTNQEKTEQRNSSLHFLKCRILNQAHN